MLVSWPKMAIGLDANVEINYCYLKEKCFFRMII